MPTFPTLQLGHGDPKVSAIGLGATGLGVAFYGGADDCNVLQMLTRAADSGITFWDTADETIGKWFRSTGGRVEIFLSTKFGGKHLTESAENIWRPNSQPSYIKTRLESSLALFDPNLEGTDEVKCINSRIDLYFQHRVDPDTPIECRIGYLGFSDCGIGVLRRTKAVPMVGEKVIAVQVEFSPFELEIETSGFAVQVRELGITIIPYSPLDVVRMISGQYKSRVDFEHTDVRLIMPRTRNAVRVEENAKDTYLKLSSDDLKVNADVQGERLPAGFDTSNTSITMAEWKGETPRVKTE
ncbi:NADP-dependent oxidoreductase domain-containing protein [Mycena rosella]|uniref:NADP-dependent oxidoreductase domain-containing protein n=1 Tax=Mycena rosella TaxID=1033263 RepID=A0AAD7DQJ9_MYCRO|nr:NADP-dependent oxidoreductase domain-containing protein [Mycena rosella]